MTQPVFAWARLAGQYAKPGSEETETRGGVTLPSDRGDLIHRPGFTAADRNPDPWLLLRGYEGAPLTLNFLRSLAKSGFAGLHHCEYWDLSFARNSPQSGAYHHIAEMIGDSRALAPLIRAARDHGIVALWIADPMHGNTFLTPDGVKTRRFAGILEELEQGFEVHAEQGSAPGGVHVELTGGNVAECVGKARGAGS